jgi:hypothetical protein
MHNLYTSTSLQLRLNTFQHSAFDSWWSDSNLECPIKNCCLTYILIFSQVTHLTPYWDLSVDFNYFCTSCPQKSHYSLLLLIGEHEESIQHLDMSHEWWVIEQQSSCKCAMASYYNTANKKYEEYCFNKTDIIINNNSSLQTSLWMDKF